MEKECPHAAGQASSSHRYAEIDWANGLEEGGVKIGMDFWPERHVYLIEPIGDQPFEPEVIIRPYFEVIFEEALNGWYRLESSWPSARTLKLFLEWFEIELHSMVLELPGSWRIGTERYDRY